MAATPALEAVFFDLDDTLHDWPAAMRATLAAIAREPDVPGLAGKGVEEALWAAIERQAFVWRDGMVVDRAYWRFYRWPEEAFSEVLPADQAARASSLFQERFAPEPFADAAPVLPLLAERLPLAVVTNNPRGHDMLTRTGLRPWFRRVFSAPEAWAKPHPRAFLAGCEGLNLEPSRVLYVGDSLLNDVEGAHAAGLKGAWIDRHGERYPVPPGVTRLETLADLPSLVDRLLSEEG